MSKKSLRRERAKAVADRELERLLAMPVTELKALFDRSENYYELDHEGVKYQIRIYLEDYGDGDGILRLVVTVDDFSLLLSMCPATADNFVQT